MQIAALAALAGGGMVAPAAAKPAAVQWPAVRLQLLTTGLPSLVSISHPDDQSGHLFIVEQAGLIRVMHNRELLAAPFLDIHTLVSCCGERGLLGLAFPPGYANKGHFFVYYTNTGGNIVIARYNGTSNPDLADPNSAVIVTTISHPTYSNHNGGQLAFGPDGYLYAGVGDGGSGGDPNNHGQSLNTELGKILRIDVEGPGCVQDPPKAQNYCIPASNPFVSTAGARPEIWAFGTRNPWRFAFDRLTGDLFIGDVGQDSVEEVDFQAAGSPGGVNYGWNILEGDQCYPPGSMCTAPAGYSAPVAVYDHGAGNSNGCSVTGGYIYRGPDIYLDMQAVYFYADYCKGKIYGLKNDGGWQTQLLITAPFAISTFGEDENGFLYVGDYSHGALYQLEAALDPAALPYHQYLLGVYR
jgi:glucose/arabinose dehydrogenase